jgi:hypothetical protein
MADPNRVSWTDSDRPTPVSSANPLVGLETSVLKTWLGNSRPLRQAHASNPTNRLLIESAVRQAVFDPHVAEMKYRAEGLSLEQAQELTRPSM